MRRSERRSSRQLSRKRGREARVEKKRREATQSIVKREAQGSNAAAASYADGPGETQPASSLGTSRTLQKRRNFASSRAILSSWEPSPAGERTRRKERKRRWREIEKKKRRRQFGWGKIPKQ